jgi:hypothetical protein
MHVLGARTGATDQDDRACGGLRCVGGTPCPRDSGVPYSGPDPCLYWVVRTRHVADLTRMEHSATLVVYSSTEGSPTWLWRTGEAEAEARDGYRGRVSLCHMSPPAGTRRASRFLLSDARTGHGGRNLSSPDYHHSAHKVEPLSTLWTAKRKGQDRPKTGRACCTSRGSRSLIRMSTLGHSRRFVAEESSYARRSVS